MRDSSELCAAVADLARQLAFAEWTDPQLVFNDLAQRLSAQPSVESVGDASAVIEGILAACGRNGWVVERDEVSVHTFHIASPAHALQCGRAVQGLTALRHTHILPFLGLCAPAPQQLWLITEHVERGSLAAWLHNRSPACAGRAVQMPQACSESAAKALGAAAAGVTAEGAAAEGPGEGAFPDGLLQRCRVALQVASAMQALHELDPPLLHRGLTSAAVWLDGEARAWLGGFSCSCRLPSSGRLHTPAGPFLAQAPEVAAGKAYHCPADVWSWGVLLVELLSGQPPYNDLALSPKQVAQYVGQGLLIPLVPPGLPPRLQALAEAALSVLPEARPSFANIVVQLAAACEDLQAIAWQPTLQGSGPTGGSVDPVELGPSPGSEQPEGGLAYKVLLQVLAAIPATS
ncbi:hypothetical protein QJQ45_002030 [Haematococcus lacustris]|nr:hypothetical protein QJQ45_002030 [Haematococcus lacustris]